MISAVRRAGLALALVIGFAEGAQAQEARVALVIGNAAYKHSTPLRNPVRDADAMAIALKEFGFEVIKTTNADRGGMARALGQFAGKLKSDGVGLFFYAGHGIQVAGANYLIPVDAEIAEEHDASLLGIDVQQVLRVMENRGSRLSMVFLDACRDNPFERAFRSAGSRGLAAIDAPRGTLLAYATAPGKTAADGAGDNGLFTAELLKAMSVPGISVDDVLKRAGAGVEQASGNKQVPWINSSYRGKFYFLGPTTVNVAPPAAPAGGNEALFWSSIKDSGDAGELEAYLVQYPNGAFAALARARLDRLKAKPQQQALATPPPVPAPGGAVQELDATYVALRTAKVRATPAGTAKELGTLTADTPVAVTGKVKDKDWLRIAWKDGAGYVSASLLKEVDAAEPAAWAKIKGSRKAEEIEAFIKAYPKGLSPSVRYPQGVVAKPVDSSRRQ